MDIRSRSLDKFISKLAVDHNLKKEEIYKVVSSQFDLVKIQMKKADSYNNHWPYIRLFGFGVFLVKPGKQKYLIKKSKQKLKDVYTEQEQQSGNRTTNVVDPGV